MQVSDPIGAWPSIQSEQTSKNCRSNAYVLFVSSKLAVLTYGRHCRRDAGSTVRQPRSCISLASWDARAATRYLVLVWRVIIASSSYLHIRPRKHAFRSPHDGHLHTHPGLHEQLHLQERSADRRETGWPQLMVVVVVIVVVVMVVIVM